MQLDFEFTTIDRALADAFGPDAFVIGGPVRDRLRHVFHGTPYDPKDKDYVITRHSFEEVHRRLAPLGRLDAVGASFGVLKWTMPGEPTVDVALPRRERSTGWGHKQFEVQSGPEIDIEEDQARRDFLMNAVAMRLTNAEVIAHPGSIEDIRARRITVINGRQSFLDDPLRMLRAAQFAARFEFEIEPQTFALMRECAPTVHADPQVAAERIAEELNKLLVKSARPSIGLRVLRDAGLLALVIPGLEKTVGVTQNSFHVHDVFDHTLAVVDATRPALVSRWAALLHDIGKPEARSAEPAKHGYTFHSHERSGAEMAERILRGLRYPNDVIEQVTRLVANHMYLADPGLSDSAIKRFINRIGTDLLDDQFELRRSDKIGSGKSSDEKPDTNLQFQQRVYDVLALKPPLTLKDLAVRGDDVIEMLVKYGIKPAGFRGGPEVGRILGELQEKVIDDPGLNTRERLVREIGVIVRGLS